jgi:hypothetical protein
VIKELKRFLSGYGRHLLWSLLIILGGLFIYLVTALSVGYRPYSGRPRSGWHLQWELLDWSTLSFLFRFLMFLGTYLLAVLTLTFILFRLLRLLGYNRIVFALLGGLITGLATFYVTLAIGWYIAINELTVIVAGGLGLIYGATLFPVIIGQHKHPDTQPSS